MVSKQHSHFLNRGYMKDNHKRMHVTPIAHIISISHQFDMMSTFALFMFLNLCYGNFELTEELHPYSDKTGSCLCAVHQVCVTEGLEIISKWADKDPRTLQLKLQKKQLSSIHTTTFFHNCNDFFNSFVYGQRFLQQFFSEKSL